MGKATPFEGELDAFGNPMCGQSFMAGTICSRPPKHDGSCAAECQNCGGDWINGTCECTPPVCSECNEDLVIEEEIEEGVCAECMLASTEPPESEPQVCVLCLEPIQYKETGQPGTYYMSHVNASLDRQHQATQDVAPASEVGFNHGDYLDSYGRATPQWCDRAFEYQGSKFVCRRSKGHAGMHGCRGADERRVMVLGDGPTPHELAEAYRSLGVELPRCTNCSEPLVWHEGNGGQWLGADPPRDWTTCHGVPDGPKHTPPV